VQIDISVVVPTFDRPHAVLDCVSSLVAQDVARHEVIVVDNACDDHLRTSLAGLPVGDTPVRYVAEPAPGLHNARHRGAREASGKLLLYTDDDVLCASGWVNAYRVAFEAHPEMVVAAGPVAPLWDEDPEQWLAELADPSFFTPYALIDRGRDFVLEPAGPRTGPFFGCNMAIRKSTLFETGGFHIELVGSRYLGDGETGLHRVLRRSDGLVGWVPNARVGHRIPRDRMSLRYLRRRAGLQGAADAYSRYNGAIPSRRALVLDAARHLHDAAHNTRRARGAGRDLRPDQIHAAMAARRELAFARYALALTYSSSRRAIVSRTDWIANGQMSMKGE
jgi:glycosyltransferase involved in cell wall biosynthesis